jgi:hypothetical protein
MGDSMPGFSVGCADTGTWYDGDFLGSSTASYDVVLHGSQGNFVCEYGFYRGRVTFDGTGDGETGTLQILFVGTSPGDIADWSGTWRILGGIGELANLHGQGILYNNTDKDGNTIPLDIHIEGQVHLAP